MKFLLTIILSTFLLGSAFAKKPDRIKISSNGKTSKIEVRYTSKSKKAIAAAFTVTDATGKVVSTQNSDFLCGDNAVCLCEALDLPEGSYTVKVVTKKKTYTSQIIIWK